MKICPIITKGAAYPDEECRGEKCQWWWKCQNPAEKTAGHIYQCGACGYQGEPALGENGFYCPECEAGKEEE